MPQPSKSFESLDKCDKLKLVQVRTLLADFQLRASDAIIIITPNAKVQAYIGLPHVNPVCSLIITHLYQFLWRSVVADDYYSLHTLSRVTFNTAPTSLYIHLF